MPENIVKCCLCGSERLDVRHRRVSPHRGGDAPATFGLLRCAGCGLIALSPRPTPAEIGAFYPSDYYDEIGVAPGDEAASRRLISRVYRRLFPDRARLRLAVKLGIVREMCSLAVSKTQRALDIGAGNGDFLEGLQKLGWETAGTDFSAESARRVTARLGGRPVYVGSFEDVDLQAQRFDLITLWDVLEHVYQPLRVLHKAAAHLAPGGRLMVSVPNFGAIEARLLGRHWPHLDTPLHLWQFTANTLALALDRAGLEVLRITTPYSLLVDHLPRALFPPRIAMDRWQSHAGRLTAQLFDDCMWRLIAPLRFVLARMGSGPALLAIARRRDFPDFGDEPTAPGRH